VGAILYPNTKPGIIEIICPAIEWFLTAMGAEFLLAGKPSGLF